LSGPPRCNLQVAASAATCRMFALTDAASAVSRTLDRIVRGERVRPFFSRRLSRQSRGRQAYLGCARSLSSSCAERLRLHCLSCQQLVRSEVDADLNPMCGMTSRKVQLRAARPRIKPTCQPDRDQRRPCRSGGRAMNRSPLLPHLPAPLIPRVRYDSRSDSHGRG